MKLSVVIPAHNEDENLRHTIAEIERALAEAAIPHEIVVIDDHSTDTTAQVLKELENEYHSLRTVFNHRPAGFGNAIHTGLDEFRGDAVCIVMADASDDPQDIVAYYRKLQEGYDCAFGSRFISGAKVKNYPHHKLVLNRLANLFIQILFGLRYNDITNAFKCYRRAVIDGIRPVLSHHFNITVELPLKAIARGYSCAVMPIKWFGREQGVSKLHIREMGSRYLFIVLYVLLEKILSRGDYVRPADAGRATPPAEVPRRRSHALLWLFFVFVTFAHVLFVKTFPLNHHADVDTWNYFYLITHFKSNLCHAPGYLFLAGLPFSIPTIGARLLHHPHFVDVTLLIGQHTFDLLCLGVLMVVVARTFNRTTAFIAVAIAGLSLDGLGATSSVNPEWLQADLLMLALAFVCPAWRSANFIGKAFWYSLSYVMFTWAYFVKFNALVFSHSCCYPFCLKE